MEKLKTEFKAKNNTYVQLEEGENFYLYGVWNLKDEATSTPSYFEIFKKNIAKESVMPNGTKYPEREVYPKDNDFGSWAWCCGTLEMCEYIKNEKSLF